MVNIHTLRDLPASNNNRSAGYVRADSSSLPMNRYSAQGPSSEGISMVAAGTPGRLPNISDMLCPRFTNKSLTGFLTYAEIIIFIVTLIVGAAKFDGAFVKSNSMVGPSTYTLYYMGGKYTYDIMHGAVWRLITPIFLHAGILHIVGNLFFQCYMGPTLELRWGIYKFGLIYLLTGISGCLWSAVLSPFNVSVGASGALFGLVGTNLTYLAYNYRNIPDSSREAMYLAFMIIVNFLFGMGSSVDNYAHLGGLISGLFCGLCLTPYLTVRDTEKYWKFGSAIGLAGLFLLFILLLFTGHPGGLQ